MFNPYRSNRPNPFIIAEVGINHNGDIDLAKKLIDVAVDSGCDAVKFQKRDVDTVIQKNIWMVIEIVLGELLKEKQKEGLEFLRNNTKK